MSSTNPGSPFGARGRGRAGRPASGGAGSLGAGSLGAGSLGAGLFGSGLFGSGAPGSGIWDAVDQLRDSFDERAGRRAGTRMGRGDVRAAVLAILAEEPMHGYQIIRAIEERTGGAWKPSPGSVYPTLQNIADESAGKKTYSLTEAGRVAAEAAADLSAPWETPKERMGARVGALPKAGAQLAQAVAQVAHSGSAEQVDEAAAALDDARRAIYAILARS